MQKEKYKQTFKKIIFHPLTLAIIVFLIVHIFNISRFDFLAQKDSYFWLLKYEDNLQYNTVNDYRQLFSALMISIHYLTGLQLFDIFKYLMPLSFLTAFFPLWIVARNLKNKFSQFLLLLAPLGTATIILQMEGTRPQIMAMLFLYFSLGIAIIAKKERNRDFAMILLGFLALIGSLFHRVFVIFLLIWIIVLFYEYWRIFLQNKIKFFVLVFLAIPWMEKVEAQSMILIAFKSLKEIFNKIFINPQFNFQFPMHYVNIDGKQIDWDNLSGVAKHYAFYVGPFFLTILFLITILILFSEKFRKFIKDLIIKKEFIFIYLMILFFLFIAEILPRIGNSAYLPDRAWVFLGVLLILPLYFLLDYSEKELSKKTYANLLSILCVGLSISIFGSTYVNNNIKNIIPDYKKESYVWIKNNIEQGSLFFSSGYTETLEYHSGMNVLTVDGNIFKNDDLSKLINILKSNNKNKFDYDLYKENFGLLNKQTDSIESILAKDEFSYADLSRETKNARTITNSLFSQINSSTIIDVSRPLYIYFAEDDSNIPYKEKDYHMGDYLRLSKDDMKLLYDHPEYFTEVYNTGNVMIWKFSY